MYTSVVIYLLPRLVSKNLLPAVALHLGGPPHATTVAHVAIRLAALDSVAEIAVKYAPLNVSLLSRALSLVGFIISSWLNLDNFDFYNVAIRVLEWRSRAVAVDLILTAEWLNRWAASEPPLLHLDHSGKEGDLEIAGARHRRVENARGSYSGCGAGGCSRRCSRAACRLSTIMRLVFISVFGVLGIIICA